MRIKGKMTVPNDIDSGYLLRNTNRAYAVRYLSHTMCGNVT